MTDKPSSHIRKNITIRKDQEGFVKSVHLNLSRFVQEKLDQYKEEYEDIKSKQETPSGSKPKKN